MNAREKRMVEAMISLYCRDKHNSPKGELCSECLELKEYATDRLENCKFGEGKPTCQNCPIHCYKPDMRERIREVMRYSGRRMILSHPVGSIVHLYKQIFKKK